MQNGNREELAWAAGFFDGEGSTSLAVGKKNKLPRISISQKKSECLYKFRRIVGFGNVYGPLRDYNIHVYSIQNAKGIDTTLTLLWPHLSEVKREQAIRCGFQLGVIRSPKLGRPKKEHSCVS